MIATSLLLATLELVEPAPNAQVVLLTDAQRAVITNETRVAREQVLNALAPDGKPWKDQEHAWRQSRPLTLRWRATANEYGPWEILLGKRSDLADAHSYFLNSSSAGKGADKKFVVPRANLEIGTTYHWQVRGNHICPRHDHGRACDCTNRPPAAVSATGVFTTENLAPRWIEIEGRVKNFRDLGGRRGRDGKVVRQGMIFRSQGLNDNSHDGLHRGRNRLMVEDVHYLTQKLGIKTDLDLRTSIETAKMRTSPLGPTVRFVHHSSMAYAGIFSKSGRKVMAENFRVFCDRANYPIVFHCIAGADRTGALGYVLNGVLGVSRQELETDWESTFYPRIPYKDAAGKLTWNSESHFDEGFGKYGAPEDSWNRRIELYLLDCGITPAEIETFRDIMLK